MNQQTHHRADIDGLRALAVILVVLYHYFPQVMPAGFVGVSVFFVISGYLISGIILQNAQRKGFFSNFYIRRINRIFPALILVLFSSLLFGWLFLTSTEYSALSRHVLASASLLQNFNLASEAGYFDDSAYLKPLQHLWSISIEEQFYIIWPLILVFLSKSRFSFVFILSFGVASVVVSAYFVNAGSVSAYYNPLSRSWELIVGALVAVLNSDFRAPNFLGKVQKSLKFNPDIISGLAVFVLIFSLFLISENSPYPYPFAFLPVVATSFFLLTGNRGKIKAHFFSNRVSVWIGKISYPLYLWHWPIYSFIQIYTGGVSSAWQLMLGLGASTFLAAITFLFLERPLKASYSSIRIAMSCVAAMCVVISCAFLIQYNKGLAWRMPEMERWASSIAKAENAKDCFGLPAAYRTDKNWYCVLGDKTAKPTAFVFGDSHALSLLPLFDQYAQSRGVSFLFTGFSRCPPLLGIQSMRSKEEIERQNCLLLNERVFEKVRVSGIKNVILAARWSYYTVSKSRPDEYNHLAPAVAPDQVFEPDDGYTPDFALETLNAAIVDTQKRYDSVGARVIFFKDVPQQIYDPKQLFHSVGLSDGEFNALSVTRQEHIENQAVVNRMLVGASQYVVDLDAQLCPGAMCPIAREGQFMYFDDDHLSVFGAQTLFPYVAPLFDRDLSR